MNQAGPLGKVEEMRGIQRRIDKLWHQEELYWSQRARVKWLEDGDKNTKKISCNHDPAKREEPYSNAAEYQGGLGGR